MYFNWLIILICYSKVPFVALGFNKPVTRKVATKKAASLDSAA
jgi:hypothetical protein